ncbi:MAG: cyclic pyranopterin monophosphate synthase MoaC [Chloroflexi bacterium]|nr:cyclic pyranopterin monophosphate synthase MoaC [Chloroflexota bacterium]
MEYRIYTDGAYNPALEQGAWVSILYSDGNRETIKGTEPKTTSNRMEMMAAIKGLERVPEGAGVTLFSDSQYLVNTMARGWKRQANLDLWQKLDSLVADRHVRWEWVQGHAGLKENEEANRLANELAGIAGQGAHQVEDNGRQRSPRGARMVDVGTKPETERESVARGRVVLSPATVEAIQQGRVPKGDVLTTAQVAGIMGAKQVPYILPLCHPIPLTEVQVRLDVNVEASAIEIEALARTTARTGVEMEALTAVAVASLTIYDMCKGIDNAIRIESVRLARKSGGKSGLVVMEQ